MPPLSVVEHFDVLEERSAGLELRAEWLTGEQFALQARKEALDHRVVIAITYRAHGAADADGLATLPEAQRGVLTAVVGVMDDALTRSPVSDRQLQRAHDQFAPEVVSHGSAHHATTEAVEDHGQIENPSSGVGT